MSSTPWAGRRLHFIGVGGAGMSGLALVARALGAGVTGSDRADSSYCERLRAAGIEPVIGHDAANVPGGAEVVVSTAIGDGNPELAAARERGAAVLHRGDLLGEVTRLRRTIAVGGTHGKTTTASMAAHVLVQAGRDPGYLIGGEVRSTGTNAAWGAGEWLVVEADESDRSFLKLTPDVAVVTNVELDHHTTFGTLGELHEAFDAFTAGARTVIADVEEPPAELLPMGSRFSALGADFELPVPGRHNVLNAMAATLACLEAGVTAEESARALRTFQGAGRRFEPHGPGPGGSEVYDDYAHHPTEVRATLEAARTLGARRVVACFQPHLYSRTRHLAREFGAALALADVVVVVDVYPARERAEDYPGVSGWLVAAAAADAARGRPVFWTPALDDAELALRAELREGDAVLTLGAGDVDGLARSLAGR
ncbi:MAG: UDP-N-acetylmuramate--alanine ligase [Thermoleophilaceae bacterium]|jgi:UDP-N-acetylmuramate--alanine ligase|nr:UDP-N-acetylmuramate--alanine ligase [Thermoleophilaceae bacterium]